MRTTKQFLEAVKQRYGLTSDYQLAKLLGVAPSNVSNFMSGRKDLGDGTALHVAELLELDPGYVMACMHAERATRPEVKKVWEDLVGKLAGTMGALLLALTLVVPSPSEAAALHNCFNGTRGAPASHPFYTLCALARRLARRVLALRSRLGRCRGLGFAPLAC